MDYRKRLTKSVGEKTCLNIIQEFNHLYILKQQPVYRVFDQVSTPVGRK